MEAKPYFDYNALKICVCKVPPLGAHGLEGFVKGSPYRFETATNLDGKKYVRIYHDREYYETCSPQIFKQYFNTIQ